MKYNTCGMGERISSSINNHNTTKHEKATIAPSIGEERDGPPKGADDGA